ncbi:unnamed protein product [Amoebophrya sp. A120]|nr:unnamed protein product [Amoebophrya sp. A120]|eukprot:GSA120T00014849001.1
MKRLDQFRRPSPPQASNGGNNNYTNCSYEPDAKRPRLTPLPPSAQRLQQLEQHIHCKNV